MSGRGGHPERPVHLVLTRAQTRHLIGAVKRWEAGSLDLTEKRTCGSILRKLWKALNEARAETAAILKGRGAA